MKRKPLIAPELIDTLWYPKPGSERRPDQWRVTEYELPASGQVVLIRVAEEDGSQTLHEAHYWPKQGFVSSTREWPVNQVVHWRPSA